MPGAIPLNQAKERISRSFLHGITAQAQLDWMQPAWDNGVDIRIGSSNAPIETGCFGEVWITVQLKATASWQLRNGGISFSIDKNTYDRYRTASGSSRFLVLYTLPRNIQDWVRVYDDYAKFSHTAYYLSIAGQPALRQGRSSVTVNFPVDQKLTHVTLRQLFEREMQRS